MNNKLKQLLTPSLTRRGFIKSSSAIGGLAAATSAISLPFKSAQAETKPQSNDEKVVWSACTVNCGSRCPLRMHVVDGEIKWVDADNTGKDDYANKRCPGARLLTWAFYASSRVQSRPPEVPNEAYR